MGQLAKETLGMAMDALITQDNTKVDQIYENENTINFLNRGIAEYLVKINGLDLEDYDRQALGLDVPCHQRYGADRGSQREPV